MKRIYTIFVFFISLSFLGNAQELSGRIIYKVKREIDKESSFEKMLLASYENYETIANEFEFSLIFNNKKSVFSNISKLYSDKYSAEIALSVIGYLGRTAQYKEYSLNENLDEEFGRFLIKSDYPDWVMHDDTKLIDNYLCFKATTSYTTTAPNGKVFVHNITAWYTPKIPYKYGPIGYGNLPGLIMELQTKRATYGVSKIEFATTNKKFKMPKLKKLKIISEEELEELAAIYEKKRRRN